SDLVVGIVQHQLRKNRNSDLRSNLYIRKDSRSIAPYCGIGIAARGDQQRMGRVGLDTQMCAQEHGPVSIRPPEVFFSRCPTLQPVWHVVAVPPPAHDCMREAGGFLIKDAEQPRQRVSTTPFKKPRRLPPPGRDAFNLVLPQPRTHRSTLHDW